MNKRTTGCLDENMISRFLEDQLTEEEELIAQEHLGNCNDCQSTLDSLVTRGRGWNELRDQLGDFAETNEYAPESQSNSEPIDEDVSFDLKKLLAPTDHPQSLGRLGRYEVHGVIGRGSAGIVLKAHDGSLNRFVAVKLLAPSFAYLGSSRKRFEREARAIASVRNAHVIEVHGVDEHQGKPFLVMRYFPGGSLHRRLELNGRMSTKEVCRIGMQIAEGLAAAHQQGIIHRDIKPANILLENGTNHAVVTDFGLASVADEATMTRSGTIAGTPQFMSPEQARGQTLDVRSDLFSLGCVMYAICTGHSPFRGETLIGVVHQVCESDPRPIREINPEIDEWLDAFIQKLLSKPRDDRFQTADEVRDRLMEELAFLQNPASAEKPVRAWMKSWKRASRLRSSRRIRTALKLIALSLLAFALVATSFGWWLGRGFFDSGNTKQSPGDQSSVREKIGKTIGSEFGIEPTLQEKSFFEAKAAYDLAYETHLVELGLRGDMSQSIESHSKALELGYNKAQSSLNLARAFAYQGSIEEAFLWINKAFQAGYHDAMSLESQADFGKLRSDSRFQAAVSRAKERSRIYQEADKSYFVDRNFGIAEKSYRKWLEESPQDDHAVMMLAASLLEQGKLDEAEVWNERTRHTVRFANFGSYNLGCIAAQRGNSDLAFNFLSYAATTGFTDIEHLENDYQLENLRDDPRFEKLKEYMRQLGG